MLIIRVAHGLKDGENERKTDSDIEKYSTKNLIKIWLERWFLLKRLPLYVEMLLRNMQNTGRPTISARPL